MAGLQAKKIMKITLITLLILFLSAVFAFTLLLLNYKKLHSDSNGAAETDPTILEKITGGTGHYWLGTANPKIIIVYFADFSCPHCKNSFSKIREIASIYKKDVKVIFRDFPAVSADSRKLALAARCAGEQGFFWPMYDKLYMNQGISADQDLINLAYQIGADKDRFVNCLSSGRYNTDIEKDYQNGLELGVEGTPTMFINGQKLAGDAPREEMAEIIDGILLNNKK